MSYDCEIPSLYRMTEPVARKQHGCVECSAPILPGEKYVHVVAVWGGDFCIEKQHLLCANACRLVRDTGINDDECVYFGGLKEFWREADQFPADHERDARRKLWCFMLAIHRRERLARKG